MKDVGVVLLTHGSREEEAVTHQLGAVVAGARQLLPDGVDLQVAHLQFGRPDLLEAVQILADSSIREIYVMPFFLLPGRHLRQDIPRMVERLASRFSGMKITLCASLGEQGWFYEVLERWIYTEIAPLVIDELGAGWGSLITGAEIMQKSLGIAGEILGQRTSCDGERAVLSRILHATGDPAILANVVLSPGAVASGVLALQRGSPIVTDVSMVKVGISRGLTARLGCPVFCAAEVSERMPAAGTRVGQGILMLKEHMEGSLVVVGNAPTALLSVIDLIRGGKARPSMVVGTPVGFVQALESKRYLQSLGVPFVTVEGTRGGSAVAVAATNALLQLAVEDSVSGESPRS